MTQSFRDDPNGNPFYNKGKVTTTSYTYKYDSHGNWIEQYSGNTLKIIRTITYFDNKQSDLSDPSDKSNNP